MTNEPHHRDDLTPLERDLAAMLRQAGSGYQPTPGQLVEGGLRRGRARLWRRRAATVTGAVAVAGIVVATQLPGGGDGGGGATDRSGPVAASGPAFESELEQSLSGLLPEGAQDAEVLAWSPEDSDTPLVSVDFRFGEADYTLDVALSRWTAADWGDYQGCVDIDLAAAHHCEDTELPDGSVRSFAERTTSPYVEIDARNGLVERGTERDGGETDPLGPGGTEAPGEEPMADDDSDGSGESPGRHWDAWLVSPTSWGPGEEGVRQVAVSLYLPDARQLPAGAEPVFTEAELIEIAEAPIWQRYLDRIDAQQGPPTLDLEYAEENEAPPNDIVDTFRSLAPDGLSVLTGRHEVPGSVRVLIDDGTSTAEIQISTYAPGSFEGDAGPESSADCEVETLDGFATFTVCPEPDLAGLPGGLYADVYYPDGASIDILQTPLSGDEGPLTLEQFREIALAPEWHELIG